jgi:hypothetical protein
MATPLYVDPAAADDTGDGSTPATAKKTVDAAYTAVDDGGEVLLLAGDYSPTTQGAGWTLTLDTSKSFTVKPDPATAPAITLAFAGATRAIYFLTCAAGKTMRFEGVTIPITTGTRLCTLGADFDGAAEFVDCVLTCGATNVSFVSADISVRTLLFSGCTITTSNESFLGGILTSDTVEVSDSTIACTSTSASAATAFCVLTTDVDRIRLLRNTITIKNQLIVTAASSEYGSVLIQRNTITWAPTISRLIYFRDDATTRGQITIEDNQIVTTGATTPDGVIYIGFSTDPVTAAVFNGPVIIGNEITQANLGFGFAIFLAGGCENAHIAFNDIRGFYSCIRSDDCSGVVVDGNYFEGGAAPILPQGGAYHRIVHNHVISKNYGGGAVNGRCMLLNRIVKATSTTTTAFTATTVTDTGVAPWGAKQGLVVAGMIAMVNTETPEWWSPLQWARVVSITGNEVTVDGWQKWDGSGDAETPTDGHVCKIMRFPTVCVITDNVFDGGLADHALTFDFIPIDPLHYMDRNMYRAGAVDLTILASHILPGGGPANLSELQDAWAAISPSHPLNDAHSQEIFYATARYIRSTRWWRMPGWSGRIRQRGLLLPI